MQLIDFDFRNIVYSIMFLFGSCFTSQPPEPITITQPKSVTTTSSFDPGIAKIRFFNENKISLVYKHHDHRESTIDISDPDTKKFSEALQKAINWNGNEQKLEVWIIGDYTNNKNFQALIEALRLKEIYKFKLISTPE